MKCCVTVINVFIKCGYKILVCLSSTSSDSIYLMRAEWSVCRPVGFASVTVSTSWHLNDTHRWQLCSRAVFTIFSMSLPLHQFNSFLTKLWMEILILPPGVFVNNSCCWAFLPKAVQWRQLGSLVIWTPNNVKKRLSLHRHHWH